MGTEGKEYKYEIETMYRSIPGAGYQYTGGDQKWNYHLISKYFKECIDKFKSFNVHSSELYKALLRFVEDEEHTGDEAEASKSFVSDNLCMVLIDTVRSIQLLEGMMVDPGFESTVPLLRDFRLDLDEDSTAIITKSTLDKIIIDFSSYLRTFNDQYPIIAEGRSDAIDTLEKCKEFIEVPTLTYLRPYEVYTSMGNLVSANGNVGAIPLFLDKFLDFLNEHNGDISNSEFKSLIDRICANLKRIEDGLGDGNFDPEAYTKQLANIVYDEGERTEEYQAYIDKFETYGFGELYKGAVYAYDPIDMNKGNFVCKKTDILIGGENSIKAKRYYAAQSEKIGILGRGWNLNYEEHLSHNGDTITLFYEDGKEGCFKKKRLGEEDVYLEIHGEKGVLRQLDDIYRLSYDNNSYIEYDIHGYMICIGDNYGPHTFIDYDIFEEKKDDVLLKKAIPTKVRNKEGSELVFKYNEKGLLIKLVDHAGREVIYRYDDAKDKYRLTSVVSSDGKARIYHYSKGGQISEIVRPDGVAGVKNEYDSIGRIISQTTADGEKIQISYDAEKHISTAIEQNGCKVEYISDEIGRHIGTRYPDLNIEEKITYNQKGLRSSYTDRRGMTTRYFYDHLGHITSVIGPEGFHEQYSYNIDGRLISKKDSEGNVTKYKYDLDGNLCCVINPMGEKYKFDYEDGKIAFVRDGENNRTKLTYDKKGNISSITNPDGTVTKYVHDNLGRVVASEDGEGNRTTYDLDVNDNILKVVDPEGNATCFEYTNLGKVSTITYPDGMKKSWKYNSIGKTSEYVDEDNRSTKFFYNASAKKEKVILPNNGTIQYEYDLLGNLTKVTDPDGVVTTKAYDKAGNILSVKKRGGAVDDDDILIESYEYDVRGRVNKKIDGNGNITRYSYDKNGNVIKIYNPNGGEVSREYDKANRLIREIDAIGRETSYTYDKNGNVLTTTDPEGVVTVNKYENNKLIGVIRKSGSEEQFVVSFEYDALGRKKKEIRQDGLVVWYNYTPNGNVSEIRSSDGKVQVFAYDSRGRVVSYTESGMVSRYTYTGTGKLKSVVDALGNKIEYTYNELDCLCRVERIGNETNCCHVTEYDYSLAGKVLSVTDALGQKDYYEYDALGKVKSHTDRDGYETIYMRDNNGNIVGIDYADGKSIRMKYNALNLLEEVQDHLGITRITRDILGRRTSVTDYRGKTVGYEYGPYDYRKAVIYPDGQKAEYFYDEFGRLCSLIDLSEDGPITYSYNSQGRLSEKVFPNGISTKMEYYPGGLLKRLTSIDNDGIIDDYSYQYKGGVLLTDIDRVRRGMDALAGLYHYEYDNLGRLIKSTLNNELKSAYKYDEFGNRIEMIDANSKTRYVYDVLDRLTRTENVNELNVENISDYSYDRRGNQTSVISNSVVRKTFEYDARNKLVKAFDYEGGSVSYDYNGLGYRVEANYPDEAIEYLCDITRRYYNLLERTVNGTSEKYVYDNNVVSMNKSEDKYYYHLDELGSTMYLTGTYGNVACQYAYDDFGRRLNPSSGKTINVDDKVAQPFLFTGYQSDEVSELYYAQARYYDSSTGRFNAEDKVRGFIRKPDSINRYLYCKNNSIIRIDLDGRTDYIYTDQNTYTCENEGSSEDRYFVEINGQRYEALSKETCELYDWNSVDTEFLDDELDDLIYEAEKKETTVARIMNESVGGELDFKLQIDNQTLYLIDGKLYNSNELGNFVWAYYLEKEGYGFLNDPLAQGGSLIHGRWDEPWDTEARNKGRDYYYERNECNV